MITLRGALIAAFTFGAWFAISATTVIAQTGDTTKVVAPPVVKPDSTVKRKGPIRAAPTVGRARIAAPIAPPVTPRRAFVYSLLVPGLGQSRLERGTAGAFFAAIELGSLAMLHKTSNDLHEARSFSGDTIPNNYVLTAGKLVATGTYGNRFPVALVSTRRLHREDWIAALAFNHLISGADAFVGAQLWDVPVRVSVQSASEGGTALVATVHW